jgi:hypothetical protein
LYVHVASACHGRQTTTGLLKVEGSMEGNSLFIVYRAKNGYEVPQGFEDAIRSLGTVIHMMPGVWHANTEVDGAAAFEELRAAIEPSDQLLVIDMTDNSFQSWPDKGPFPPATS